MAEDFGYTRITSEVATSGKAPADKVIIEKAQWDCTITDIIDMIRALCLAMGFAPETVDGALGGNDDE